MPEIDQGTVAAAALVITALVAIAGIVGRWANSEERKGLPSSDAKYQEELARRQLEALAAQELASRAAQMTVVVERGAAPGHYVVRVSNRGPSDALDVIVEPVGNEDGPNLLADDVAAKFPISRLRADEEVKLIGIRYLSAIDPHFQMNIRWRDGSSGRREEFFRVAA